MFHLTEQASVGINALSTVTTLLQRARSAHPTRGLYEAADLQWWWAQSSHLIDSSPQLFWIDDLGRPEAAVITTEWSYGVQLDPLFLPGATPELVVLVVERGLDRARARGFQKVQLEVDRTDHVLRDALSERGFEIEDGGYAETWLDAEARPEVSPLREGYRMACRLDTKPVPHHFIKRNGTAVEQRLLQTSLYRPDLDLVVLDRDDHVAAYGLFWFDPVTTTGMVEPMRTEDNHQQRGLARHLLTAGIELLSAAGAERIKICFELSNPASSRLYPSVGFKPVKQTDMFEGPTTPPTSAD